MEKSSFLDKHYQLILEAVKAIPNKRTQEIITGRFGLDSGQRQTLEAVGQKYNITRERVRQIEEAAFAVLREPASEKPLKPIFQLVNDFFIQQGQLVREEKLLADLTGVQSLHPFRGALFFTLTLGKPYQRFVESKKFYPLWTSSKNVLNKAQRLVDALVKKLAKEDKIVTTDYVLSFCSAKAPSLSESTVLSYLDATKEIHQNSFGHFGLTSWPEISPRGVKDKAYIIFKQQNEPLHFRQVAQLINQAGFDSNEACPQTVHNELIKDARFVLVGRGTYALTDWGYQPGTVKEVISQLLTSGGPLVKKEILEQVLKSRLVKENTVLINLQNRKYFIRGEDNKYRLNTKV